VSVVAQEDVVELRDLEDASHLGPYVDDVQLPAETVVRGDERGETARVDEGGLGEIDGDGALTVEGGQGIRELGCGREVQLAGDRDASRLALQGEALDDDALRAAQPP